MTENLWGEKISGQRKRKKTIQLSSTATPYSITGNDCEILGHTLSLWDLAGCNVCLDCGVKIFCPRCITMHPQVESAIAVMCERHEEPQESQVSA